MNVCTILSPTVFTPKKTSWQNFFKRSAIIHGRRPFFRCKAPFGRTLSTVLYTRLRSTSRGDFIVPRFNRQLSYSSFSVAAPSAWNRLPSHIRTSSTYTLFLTRLKTHLFAESLLWHCYAVVFSLYFWRPRALDVGRHSKFMLIDWLIDWQPNSNPLSKLKACFGDLFCFHSEQLSRANFALPFAHDWRRVSK